MASTVTYNGVENAEGGTIFKDVKFWMAQRVPQRSRWIDLIKQNGGVVVHLEKQADMLIADHARAKKDAPHGSYSWQFIDDSVKNGIIQLKDRYLIGPPPNAPRPVGSGQPTKSTRTPFTPEDDARIARWVLQHPTDQKGNEIWKEYACISWRDRYVKKLANLDRGDLERMAASAPEEILPDNHDADQAGQSPKAAERNPPQAAAQQIPKQKQRTGTREDRRQLNTARQHQQETSLSPVADTAGHQIQPGPVDTPEGDDARDTFYRDLDDWIASTDRDIKRYLKIEGISFELFDLALAAQAVLYEIGSCDWIKIAEKLGFVNPTDHMLNELHLCYQENLDDFLAQIQNFEDEPVPDSEAIAPELDLSQDIKWEDDQDDQDGSPQTYERSSPPVVATGLKRSTAHRPLTSSGNVHKKRRHRPDDDTPSTPDADLALGILREPSPSARVSSQWLDYVGESEASQHLPPLPPQQDELQDSRTIAVAPQETRQQSVDVDPLPDNELLDSTPIPFHLNKTGQDRPSATKRRQLRTEPSRGHRHNSLAHVTNPRRAVSSATQNQRPAAEAVRRSLPASYNSSRNRAPQNPPARSSQPRDPDSSNSREIQERISYYESMGFPRHIVIEGLKRTTLTPGKLALLVMQYLNSGRGVPSRHEGIWTDRDDEDLRFSSSVDFGQLPADDEEEQEQELAQKAHNRLVKKHGKQRFELRKAFLEAQTTEGKHGAKI
ncbi:unnamed protein product [Fusarium equiseti]|uniref:DNA-binding protein RAP1 n=1 Tax=Fusarium equiseti TaxID=61235 RepID=A0A8J2NNW0_FUSEQ|nr:unnamed protein product [Fusarium equiseti]